MAQTFHPCEEGNFVPLRTRSGELLAKAILLSASKPPVIKDKPSVHKALENLEEQCEKIHELVGKNVKDEVLLKETQKWVEVVCLLFDIGNLKWLPEEVYHFATIS